MKKIILYIAMSLDGCIADPSGGVAWLEGDDPDLQDNQSHTEFLNTVDTIIMGYTTYRQIITDLSPEIWQRS